MHLITQTVIINSNSKYFDMEQFEGRQSNSHRNIKIKNDGQSFGCVIEIKFPGTIKTINGTNEGFVYVAFSLVPTLQFG